MYKIAIFSQNLSVGYNWKIEYLYFSLNKREHKTKHKIYCNYLEIILSLETLILFKIINKLIKLEIKWRKEFTNFEAIYIFNIAIKSYE